MLKLLEGLVPVQGSDEENGAEGAQVAKIQKDADEDGVEDSQNAETPLPCCLTPEHLHNLYVFALIWGMGAFLDISDRRKFSNFLHEKLASVLHLPKSDSMPDAIVFDFVVSQQGKKFKL